MAPPLPSSAPLTPLGARTPMAHPGLYTVIVVLSLIIVVGALWVFWPRSAATPEPSPSPSLVPSPSQSAPSGELEFRNDSLGLSVTLPTSWEGFVVTQSQQVAEGLDTQSTVTDRTYTELRVKHPLSTTDQPRQDIPIMAFTIEQWSHVGQPGENEWSVSAAPIPPSELARNSRFVFALPARYNYAFPPGWEEVDELIRNGAVTAF